METLKLKDGTLFYEEKGVGPSLLFLHAAVADSRMWAAQVDALAGKFRVARCDLRGYGRSLLPAGPFSYAADVRALVEALDLAPTWIVGASYGGLVAVDFYLSYPHLVSGLILVSPAVSGMEYSEEVTQFSKQEDELYEAGKLEEATELNVRLWVDGPYRDGDVVDPAVRNLVAEMQYQAFAQPEPENVSLQRIQPPAIERLGDIQAPLLVISGGLDVSDFGQIAEKLAGQVPGAKHVVVPDAAHMVSMEKPDLFNQLIVDFVAS